MSNEKISLKGQKVSRCAHKQGTLKAIFTVSVIFMLVGTMLMVVVPSGNAGAEDNVWEEKFPSTKPSARSGHSMVYDSKNNKIVLFGGTDGSNFFQDTWVYDVSSDTWTQKNPSSKPTVRSGHAMVYDSTNEKILLFGGDDGSGTYFQDTWEYYLASDTWTQKNPSTKPQGRDGHAMTYDSKNEKVVLFGGVGVSPTYKEDTWVYDLASDTWTEKNPSTHPSHGGGMAYDATSNKIVFFGGEKSGTKYQDTWVYEVATDTWTEKYPTTKPSERYYHTMVYDSENEKIVLFSGYTPVMNDTWIYDSSSNNWTQMNPSIKPPARRNHAIAYDGVNNKIVMFGGYDDSNYLQDTWTYTLLSQKLTLESSPTYYQSDLVTINATYSDGTANITFQVKDPDDQNYLIETIQTQESRELEEDENTVALWHFNEGSGDTVYDETDNDNDGIINGAKWTDGISGKALEFDGEDDYVSFSESNSLDLGNKSFSIECWFKLSPESKSDQNALLCKEEIESNLAGFWLRINTDGHVRFLIRCSPGETDYLITGSTDVCDNQWHQVVAVRDEVDHELRLYIDGNEDVFPVGTTPKTIDNDENLWIGRMEEGYNIFNGTIDEVRISNTARTPEEIKASYFEKNTATLLFTLPKSAKIGTYTVYATNDKDDSKDNITFEVKTLVKHLIIKLLDFPSSVNLGDTLNVDFTIENTFETAKDVTLVLQLKDANKRALRPKIEDKTISASSTPKHTLSVDIPTDAEIGTYFLQGQMLTDLPENNGYSIDFQSTSIKVS